MQSLPPESYLIEFLKDLPELDRRCRKAQLLNRLTFLTITIDFALRGSEWVEHIASLASSSPLEYFQLYGTTITRGLQREIQLDDFVAALVSAHGPRLKRFSLHRLPISLKALDGVCTGFTDLEHLFIVVGQEDLVGSYPRVF